MPGHIQLGAPGDMRDYMLLGMDRYSKVPANQFAAKLSTGAGSYDDLQNWSYLVMDDWRAGVGKKDPEGGGFLYAEAETRYPGRLTLPNALLLNSIDELGTHPLNSGWQPGEKYPNSTLDIGTTHSVKRIAHAVNGADTGRIYITVWLNGTPTTDVTVALYSSTNNGTNDVPDAEIASASFYTDNEPGAKSYSIIFVTTLAVDEIYHIVIYPTTAGTTLSLPVVTSGVVSADSFSTYNGTSWTGGYTSAFLHGAIVTPSIGMVFPTRIKYFPATGCLYTVDGNYVLWKKESDDTGWQQVATLDSECTDMCVVGDELWIAQDIDNIAIMDAAESITYAGVQADILLKAGGYLWRALEGDAYYTGDGVTWDGPITVAWNGSVIRSMAQLDDTIYCACDDGMYYIGAGDQVRHVMSFPSVSPQNGIGMINHQGTLFVPVQQSIYRYDGAQMLPVGFDLGEGLPQDRVGVITGMLSLNNWLLCFLDGVSDTSRAAVWAYNDQGWHYLAGLPYGVSVINATYDVTTRNVYMAGDYNLMWRLPIADSANFNNVSAYPMPKMPCGWLETDWFFGNLFEVYKDCESVYVTGDGFNATHTAQVYWKDDDSTDWELLGTIANNRTELRWDDYGERPDTRQIKIGVAIYTQDDNAPVIRAIRLKYHPMVSDWFRWNFPLIVTDYTPLLGGEKSPYTRAEQEEHLDGIIKQRQPTIFRDIDGVSLYEVKVTGSPIQVTRYEYQNDGPHYDLLFNVAIEQIRPAKYGE